MNRIVALGKGLLLLACAWPLTANAADNYRFHRPITAPAGWVRLTLPNDVLDKARPQLSDVRIFANTGEVPYALEENLSPIDATLEFTNVASRPGRETTARLDRGSRPTLCRSVELIIAQSPPFLKPVVVESSDDLVSFSKIAQSSIFATPEGHHCIIGFAPNDKRYLRIRLDDRLSAPIHPVSAILRQTRVESGLDEFTLKYSTAASSNTTVDTYALELPASNLILKFLRIDATNPVFSRSVRIYETLMFRGELSRRLIREGLIRRAPGGEDALQVQADEVVGRRLEVEIEQSEAPMTVKAFTARIRPRALLFLAPSGVRLELAYGSPTARTPQYDVGTALASARPQKWSEASLGLVRTDSEVTGAPTAPRRGQTVDIQEWQRRQPIQMPTEGTLAYLDLPPAASDHLPSVRIVDSKGAQVPYVMETEARHTTAKVEVRITSTPSETQMVLSQLATETLIDGIGLAASAPDLFERSLTVTEAITDARGEIGRRTLAHDIWKRAQGEMPARFWLSIDRPSKPEVTITVNDGDNAALVISDVVVQSKHRRIDFAFTPDEKLALIWQNPRASSPRYDVALMANTILTSPALPATLGPVEITRAATHSTPKWFWWVASIAGLIVTALLARTLLTPAAKGEDS